MRMVRTEINKSLCSPVTVLMIIAVAVVCMLSEGYVERTDGVEHSRTVLSLMLSNDAELLVSDVDLNWLEMWRRGFGQWTYILLPLLLTGGYVYTLSEERLHGGTQFYLIRSGRVSYCISKTISAMVSGGVILSAGYLLYGLIVAAWFPALSIYPAEKVASYLEFNGISAIAPYILSRFLWVFLYGMMTSIFGYVVSVLFTEKYILLCFPLMLSYVYSTFYTRIVSYLMEREKWDLVEKIGIVNLESVLIDGVGIKSRAATVVYLLALYLCCMLLFLMIMKRKEVR